MEPLKQQKWKLGISFQKGLTALMTNAASDPNPTREFMFGDPFLNALRPSKSNSVAKFEALGNQKMLYLSFEIYQGPENHDHYK